MIVNTERFGQVQVQAEDLISVPQGLLGFPQTTRFCLLDPSDETLILWLQSADDPGLSFPVLEPKIFRPDYTVRLSTSELRDLKLENIADSAVYCVLTIPTDPTQMTANLKAPIVVNLREQVARQVVLQENEYLVKQPVFKELRAHLVTLKNHQNRLSGGPAFGTAPGPISIRSIPPSHVVKSLT